MGSSGMGPDYWCYRCRDTVNPPLGGNPMCPRCSDGFIELMSDPNRDHDRYNSPGSRRLLGLFQSPESGGIMARRRRRSPFRDEDEDGESVGGGGPRLVVVGHSAIMDLMHALGSDRASDDEDEDDERRARRERERERERDRDREGLNVTLVLQRRVRGGLEENLGILFESDGVSGGSRGLPRSLGDYFVGPGLDLLIQRLSENDPNRYGTPPAAKTAVDALPTVKISEKHFGSDLSQCVVCMEEFELGGETRQMPCKHLYHGECILPWLKLHSSCPVCRFQLATEDQEDTSGKKNPEQDSTNNSSSSSSSSENGPQRTGHVSNTNNNDNGASTSSSANNDNGASSSSSVAPRVSATNRSWFRNLFHSHSDHGDGPESGGC